MTTSIYILRKSRKDYLSEWLGDHKVIHKMPFLKEVLGIGLGLKKGCVVMTVKECVIKIIPSKCIQNSITSHQLRGFSYM